MAFSYSTTTTAHASTTTSQAANLPATVDSGDLLIALYQWRGGDALISTGPAGWTQKQAQETRGTTSTGNSCAAYAKIADGTEDGGTATLTIDTAREGTAIVIRVTAATWSGNLAEVEFGTATNQSTTTPNPPSLTASWGSDANLWVAWATAADDDITFSVFPTNYVDSAQVQSGGGTNNGGESAVAFRELTTDTENPGAFTLADTDSWVANTIVIRSVSQNAQVTGVSGTLSITGQTSSIVATTNVAITSVSGTLRLLGNAATVDTAASGAEITVVSGAVSITGNTAEILTTPLTNNKLVVFVGVEGGATGGVPDDVFYDGVELTFITSATHPSPASSNTNYVSAWYIDNPAAESGDIEVSFSVAQTQVAVVAITLSRAKLGAPTDTTSDGIATSDDLDVTLTLSQPNMLVLAGFGSGSDLSDFSGTQVGQVDEEEVNLSSSHLLVTSKAETVSGDSISGVIGDSQSVRIVGLLLGFEEQPDVAQNAQITSVLGTVSITGQTSTVVATASAVVTSVAGAVQIVGNAATVDVTGTINAEVNGLSGTIQVVGQTADVTVNENVVVTSVSGTLKTTGQIAEVTTSLNLWVEINTNDSQTWNDI